MKVRNRQFSYLFLDKLFEQWDNAPTRTYYITTFITEKLQPPAPDKLLPAKIFIRCQFRGSIQIDRLHALSVERAIIFNLSHTLLLHSLHH